MGVATRYNAGFNSGMNQTPDRQKAHQRGQWAEAQALAYLESQGLVLCARNVRYRCGELDLIMTDGVQLVFVEVRYRARSDYGGAAGSVNRQKRQRISRAAMLWLQSRPGPVPACRFDLVVLGPGGLQWLPAAFLAGGLL